MTSSSRSCARLQTKKIVVFGEEERPTTYSKERRGAVDGGGNRKGVSVVSEKGPGEVKEGRSISTATGPKFLSRR